MDVFVQLAAVHNLFDDTYLLFMLFVGIAVVGINDAGRILQIPFIIEGEKRIQILIMVVGNITAVLVGGATQYGMRKLIACGVDLPAPVDEGMGMLRRIYGCLLYTSDAADE